MNLGLLVLRVLVGLLFLGHASHKFFGSSHRVMGFAGGMGPKGTAAYMESVGLKPGLPNVVVAGVAELVSGALLICGLALPVAGALMFAVLTVALVIEHLPKGMWEGNGGIEYPLLLLGALFTLVCVGPGAWSLDRAAGIHPTGWRWGLAVLVLGLAGAGVAVAAGRFAGRRSRGSSPAEA